MLSFIMYINLTVVKGDFMIKLISTDMDGTLLDENGHLPEGFTEILDRLRKRILS